jgi:hypothetical protein
MFCAASHLRALRTVSQFLMPNKVKRNSNQKMVLGFDN